MMMMMISLWFLSTLIFMYGNESSYFRRLCGDFLTVFAVRARKTHTAFSYSRSIMKPFCAQRWPHPHHSTPLSTHPSIHPSPVFDFVQGSRLAVYSDADRTQAILRTTNEAFHRTAPFSADKRQMTDFQYSADGWTRWNCIVQKRLEADWHLLSCSWTSD